MAKARDKNRYVVGWCGKDKQSTYQVYGWDEKGQSQWANPIKSLNSAKIRAKQLGPLDENYHHRAIFKLVLAEKID